MSREPQLPASQCFKGLKEKLKEDILYNDETIEGLIKLFRLLRDHLVIERSQYTKFSDNNKLIYGIPPFSLNKDDRKFEMEQLTSL